MIRFLHTDIVDISQEIPRCSPLVPPIPRSWSGLLIVLLFQLGVLTASVWAAEGSQADSSASTEIPAWSQVRSVQMQGDWKVFWNVGGGDIAYNNREALAHGFRLVNLLNTYADYPGKQKENISHALKDNHTNPWKKPDYFERIIRRNIAQGGPRR